jgi:hypothetical protein
MISALTWVGNAFIVTGLYKIADKWRHAFLFSIAGETCWMLASYARSDWALLSICGVFNIMALRSWIKWGQDAV